MNWLAVGSEAISRGLSCAFGTGINLAGFSDSVLESTALYHRS
jgi:hypothetical protein